MIIGIGTDLVEIRKMEKLLAEYNGERFMNRLLTPAEKELAAKRKKRLGEFLAGRFAAKEAVAKALGCGIGGRAGFRDIEVLPDEQGKPTCRLSEPALKRLGLPPFRIHLSITHSETAAAAFAIVEQR